MTGSILLLTGLVALFAAGIHAVRSEVIPRAFTLFLAAVCAVGLLAMLITDWPTEALNEFWAEHSVLTSVTSTLLVVGVGYLLWEERDRANDQRLADGLSGAGLGGIVNHMVDAETALALVSANKPPTWSGWDELDKPPLRWLRQNRTDLYRDDSSGGPQAKDPRSQPADLPASDPAWRIQLVDQVLRRILTGMKEWSPLIGRSRDGTTALLYLAEIRKDLMELGVHLSLMRDSDASQLLESLRMRLRVLAYFFEDLSRNSARQPTRDVGTPLRPEVLLTLRPLRPPAERLSWKADVEDVPEFGRTWRRRLSAAVEGLSAGA